MSNQVSSAETFTILPGQTVPRNGLGNFFYFIEANGPLMGRSNLDPLKPFDVGTGVYYGPKTKSFNRMEIANEQSFPITVTLYRGFARYIDRRLNTTAFRRQMNVPIVPPLSTMESQTWSPAAAEEISVVGGHQRCVTIFSLENAAITVLNESGNVIDQWEGEENSYRTYCTDQTLTFRQTSGDGSYTIFEAGNLASAPAPGFELENGDGFLLENGDGLELDNP